MATTVVRNDIDHSKWQRPFTKGKFALPTLPWVRDFLLEKGRTKRRAGSYPEQRLVIEQVWPCFSYFGDDVKPADKISQPQVQVLSMDISCTSFLKLRTHEVEEALNIATLVFRLLVPVTK